MISAQQAEFEAKTTAVEIQGKPVTVAKLRYLFDSVCVKHDWKAGFTCAVIRGQEQHMAAAIEWFHGAAPVVVAETKHTVALESKGYAC